MKSKLKRKSLFSIGEVCKAFSLTRKTILMYEKEGILVPSYRSTDSLRSNRYYDIDAISRLKSIVHIKDIGFPLKEIKKFMKSDFNYTKQIEELYAKRKLIEYQIQKLNLLNRNIDLDYRFDIIPVRQCYFELFVLPLTPEDCSKIISGIYETALSKGYKLDRKYNVFIKVECNGIDSIILGKTKAKCYIPVVECKGESELEEVSSAKVIGKNFYGDAFELGEQVKKMEDYLKEQGLKSRLDFYVLFLDKISYKSSKTYIRFYKVIE